MLVLHHGRGKTAPLNVGTIGPAPQVAELNFTPGQRRLLVALRKLYLRNLGVLARRRQQLARDLQVQNGFAGS
jgi:hypothetical protein